MCCLFTTLTTFSQNKEEFISFFSHLSLPEIVSFNNSTKQWSNKALRRYPSLLSRANTRVVLFLSFILSTPELFDFVLLKCDLSSPVESKDAIDGAFKKGLNGIFINNKELASYATNKGMVAVSKYTMSKCQTIPRRRKVYSSGFFSVLNAFLMHARNVYWGDLISSPFKNKVVWLIGDRVTSFCSGFKLSHWVIWMW